MSKRQCSICVHPDRAAIDAQLFANVNQKDVAEQFSGASRFALSRHWRNCLAATAIEEGNGETLEVQAARWLQRADDIYAVSTVNGDVRGQVQSLTAAFRGLELQSRSEQRLTPAPESDSDGMTLQELDKLVAKFDRIHADTDKQRSHRAIAEAQRFQCHDLYDVFVRVWNTPALKERLLNFCNEELFRENTHESVPPIHVT